MTNDFSYRDPKLSLWQAAVGDHLRKQKLRAPMGASSIKLASRDELMSPVHVVAKAIKGAGKPFEALAHDIKVGVLHLKDLFDPLKDCAEAAAHFLWAELTANEENSKIYQGELAKSDCDAAGWSECLVAYLGYKALLQAPKYRPNQGSVIDLGTKSKLAIIGDWGTGEDVATNVLKQVAAMKPDVLLHLGDVYYAGTQSEAKANFLDICKSVLGDIPLYSLCGNHDMYSGGAGYYWLLDQIGQKASYFCLQNADWMLLAMDTGFHDNDPFTVTTNMTKLVSQDGWSEADWHLKQIQNAGNRKLVLLSHHQLFSPFGSVGSVNGTPYAYNPNLYDVFKDVLKKLEWWFWGHEHTLGVFGAYMGLGRGRCIGASAVPVFQDQQSYSTASGLTTFDGNMPKWLEFGVLKSTDDTYNNCFAMMTLSGAAATVDYYEVPLMKDAIKLSVTDHAEP